MATPNDSMALRKLRQVSEPRKERKERAKPIFLS